MKSTKRATSGAARPAQPTTAPPGFSAWLAPLAVGLATLLAFYPSLLNDFVNWDDDKILYDNPYYRGLGWEQIKWMFSTMLMGHYQPLTWLSFGLDYQFWGMAPFGYHLTSLLLHAANAVLFYWTGRRLLHAAIGSLPDDQLWRLDLSAALAALLFAIHPLRVESVAWATERRDVLSGLFYFATIYFYLRAAAASPPSFHRRWLGAAVIAYVLSLLSKATAMTLPVVLLLLDVYPLKRLALSPADWFKPASRPLLYEKLPFFILAGGFAATALFAQQVTGALKPLEHLGVISRLLQIGFAYMFYLWKTVWPFGLAPIYELPIESGSWFWIFLLSTVATVGLTLTCFCQMRRWPMIAAAWVYYLVVLSPVSGVAQSGPQLVADRYSYLACLGWPLLVAGGFFRFWPRRGLASTDRGVLISGTALLVFVGLGFLTWRQTLVWRSPVALWQHGTAAEPLASIAHYNFGRALERENRGDDAIESYRRAVAVNPSYSKAHFNLARLLAVKGSHPEAMTHYRRVIEIRPDHADAHNDLGLLLELTGDDGAALGEFRRAIQFDPEHPKAWFNLAELLAKQGDLVNATVNYQTAARLQPGEAAIQVRLAIALARQGQLDAATRHLQRAVELQPTDAAVRVLLARSLAAQGRQAEAERHFQDAQRLSAAAGKTSLNSASGMK